MKNVSADFKKDFGDSGKLNLRICVINEKSDKHDFVICDGIDLVFDFKCVHCGDKRVYITYETENDKKEVEIDFGFDPESAYEICERLNDCFGNGSVSAVWE